MNISTIQNLVWVSSLACAGYLGYFLYEFRQPEAQQRLQRLDNAMYRGALEEGLEIPEPEKHMEYDFPVVKRLFHTLDWSGKEPEKPVVVEQEPDKPVVTSTKPIADLVEVIFVRAATFDPSASQALVNYKDGSLARNGGDDQGLAELYVGDHLPEPHAYAFVKDIVEAGVVFGFDDEEREAELVEPPVVDNGVHIVEAGPEGALVPVSAALIGELPDAPVYRPAETILIGPNHYQWGTDDAADAEANFAEYIAQVRHRRYRDPNTGQYAGIWLQDVPTGSFAAKHGLKSGDVIKSINGHPISSPQEGIQFAKNNQDKYSTWDVVIENKGVERTVTYESPED